MTKASFKLTKLSAKMPSAHTVALHSFASLGNMICCHTSQGNLDKGSHCHCFVIIFHTLKIILDLGSITNFKIGAADEMGHSNEKSKSANRVLI